MENIITVLGSLNMDLSIQSPKELKMGETIRGSGFITGPGGKGANQAAAMGRLGADVYMVGNVGDDLFGRRLRENLESNGVHTDCLGVSKCAPTGTAVIIVVKGNNVIILDPGSNDTVDRDTLDNAERIIRQSRLLAAQLEIPYDAVDEAFRRAKAHGVTTLLNPSPYREIGKELLQNTDILMANEHEASAMTGREVTDIQSAMDAAKCLLDMGISTPVITLGPEGCVYHNGTDAIHAPAIATDVVDTTAAGDAFLGAFAVTLVNGRSIDEAVRFALLAGAITVSRRGAQDSLPSLSEVEALAARKGY